MARVRTARPRPARALHPVGLRFAGTAPVRLTFTARLAAAPAEVYRALVDEVEAWPRWFPAVTLARQVEHDRRRGREIRVLGVLHFVETVLVTEPDRRYAYRVDLTNAPGVRALLEDWCLRRAGGGTVLQWCVAADGPPPVRLALRLARPGLRHAFHDAVRALDRRLAAV
ncbi:SRPBCC family protein [Streptomyces mashuensis]|nr:SRPBCC family protein [Streptomyces mashuensis]